MKAGTILEGPRVRKLWKPLQGKTSYQVQGPIEAGLLCRRTTLSLAGTTSEASCVATFFSDELFLCEYSCTCARSPRGLCQKISKMETSVFDVVARASYYDTTCHGTRNYTNSSRAVLLLVANKVPSRLHWQQRKYCEGNISVATGLRSSILLYICTWYSTQGCLAARSARATTVRTAHY